MVGALLWCVAVAGIVHWYGERAASEYVADTVRESQLVAAATAKIVNRSFRELDIMARVLTQRVDIQQTLSRHASTRAELSALPLAERAQRLRADPVSSTTGDALATIAAKLGYDWSRLQHLARPDQGGEDVVRTFIAMLISAMPQRIAAMQQACQNGDAHALYEAAHALKSSAAQAGAIPPSRGVRGVGGGHEGRAMADGCQCAGRGHCGSRCQDARRVARLQG